MDFWTLLAWSGVAGFLIYNYLLQQQQSQDQARQRRVQQLQRVQEAAAAAKAAPVQPGKKGKGKKGKLDAPKGMGAGLDANGGASASVTTLEAEFVDQPLDDAAPLPDAPLPDVLAGYLAKAEQHRMDMGDKRATIEHLVLAMAEDPRFGEVLGCTTGFQEEDLKTAIKKSRVIYNRGQEYDEAFEMSVLSKYSRDLTEMARAGKLDPVIGRADEMRRVIDVLCRRTKNSAVLLGEAGVGKTAIIEGLAQRIAQDDVPEGLRGCKVIALEMGLLMAGAAFPGEFEERLRGVLKELQQEGLRAILFIDDIHTITGPNAQQGGGVMDASVMLKPLLSRGEVRCLGCTSLDKYRKFIEKDPGLERRFQQVPVEPPSVSETISILRGLRHKYEKHHGVRITDAALAAAANLGDRYLPDRFLPDKAIDLVDEAAAKVKTDLALRPEALDRIERRIGQLEKECKLLARSAVLDTAIAAELEALEGELARLKAEASEMTAALEADIKESDRTQSLQDEIDRLNAEIEAAEEEGNTAKADTLKRQKREELVRKLRTRARSSRRTGWLGGGKLTRAEVSEPDIARVISKWTGIPLTKLVESEAGKLLALADDLHKRIIGQNEAVVAVAEAIQRSRAGMKDPNGPIASFLFLGPTGVGKTELAKALASNLFNTDDAMTRLDMSEYMEKHAVAKLIGAPPGYVGYDEGGQLTEQVRRKPYSVVLFDEVEKAHVDVFNLLLQILDDGRVTDSQGRVVSFKNAIIILTSNLGSAEVFNHTYKQRAAGTTTNMAEMRELVMEKVRKHFQPEFINRIDEFIIFEPLRAEQIETIVRLQVRGVGQRLSEKKMKLLLQDSAVRHLAAAGFDPVYGARPVKRAVQRELETPLAKALLTGQFQEEDTVVVEAAEDGGYLGFSRIPGARDEDAESTASDGGGGGGGAASSSTAAAAGPIPVTIPGHAARPPPRPAARAEAPAAAASSSSAGRGSSSGGARGGSSSGGGGGGGGGGATATTGVKFDPLGARGKKKAAPQQPAVPGDGAEGGGQQQQEQGQQQQQQQAAVNGSGSDLGEGVASLLHGGEVPAFLKTPRRRDEQEDAPTCAE